ncbi:MAG: cyclase family protein [Chloroflexaceae bacterium]|jgi:kynurenine formamidase|nr:cyclase family protein [Chloroflexaceae bacterium]
MAQRLIDLTQPIFEGMVLWTGHPPTKITVHATHESTAPTLTPPYSFTAETIQMTTHAGTHVDSISHIDPRSGAPSIEQIPLEWFYTEAICIDLSHLPPRTEYSVADIEAALAAHNLSIKPGDTVLIHSGHYARTRDTPAYASEYSGLSREAAEFIYGAGAINIGAEAPSVDVAGTTLYPAHLVCREMQRLNTENLADLSEIVGKRFRYLGLPLPIRNGTGSPIRAVAVLEE